MVSVTSAAWDPKLEVALSGENHRLTVASAAFGVPAAFVGLQPEAQKQWESPRPVSVSSGRALKVTPGIETQDNT